MDQQDILFGLVLRLLGWMCALSGCFRPEAGIGWHMAIYSGHSNLSSFTILAKDNGQKRHELHRRISSRFLGKQSGTSSITTDHGIPGSTRLRPSLSERGPLHDFASRTGIQQQRYHRLSRSGLRRYCSMDGLRRSQSKRAAINIPQDWWRWIVGRVMAGRPRSAANRSSWLGLGIRHALRLD